MENGACLPRASKKSAKSPYTKRVFPTNRLHHHLVINRAMSSQPNTTTVPFSVSHAQNPVRLLELPPAILSLLTSPNPPMLPASSSPAHHPRFLLNRTSPTDSRSKLPRLRTEPHERPPRCRTMPSSAPPTRPIPCARCTAPIPHTSSNPVPPPAAPPARRLA